MKLIIHLQTEEHYSSKIMLMIISSWKSTGDTQIAGVLFYAFWIYNRSIPWMLVDSYE